MGCNAPCINFNFTCIRHSKCANFRELFLHKVNRKNGHETNSLANETNAFNMKGCTYFVHQAHISASMKNPLDSCQQVESCLHEATSGTKISRCREQKFRPGKSLLAQSVRCCARMLSGNLVKPRRNMIVGVRAKKRGFPMET